MANLLSRRDFLSTAVGVGSGLILPRSSWGLANVVRKPRVAAVVTVLRFRSHAYNILENFFEPYLFRGQLIEPGVEVTSLFVDQYPEDDMARDVSRKFQLPLYDSIDKALCRGSDKLDVDAVLLIGEHGEYPFNELGQHQYPRKQFFDEIIAVMKRSNRAIPLFNDKHLSHRWDWAREMYDVSRQLGFPMLAGSSVPLAERRPAMELPTGAKLSEAVSIHGGGLEVYDFHGLEVLQSIVESRHGGECGVASVEVLANEKYDEAEQKPDWPRALIEAAMNAEREHDEPRQSRPRGVVLTVDKSSTPPPNMKLTTRHAIRLTYRDGFKATVIKNSSSSDRWNFACQVKEEASPRACMFFNGPWGNRCLFKALSHAIQHMFRTGESPYPIERTLLVSGILDAAMHSHGSAGKLIDTPHLAVSYTPKDFSKFRENGASWRILTRDTPQPTDFSPGDRR